MATFLRRGTRVLVGVFFLGLFLVVYFSDTRPRAVKDVDQAFELGLSKRVAVISSNYRTPSFLGDGEDYIELQVPKEEAGALEEKILSQGWNRASESDWDNFLARTRSYRGDTRDFKNLDQTYFKLINTLDANPQAPITGNYDACIYDGVRGRIYYLDYDS